MSWAWYSGGWNDAVAGHSGPLFQYHHQPFNYFAAYAPGQPGRNHLKDETDFVAAAQGGTLPTVSFVKPYGAENEHPGYARKATGNDHLVDLLRTIDSGPQADDTLVVVTYDEFGGAWDHLSPPGEGSRTKGVSDQFGPGTRVPALVLSRSLPRPDVDHTGSRHDIDPGHHRARSRVETDSQPRCPGRRPVRQSCAPPAWETIPTTDRRAGRAWPGSRGWEPAQAVRRPDQLESGRARPETSQGHRAFGHDAGPIWRGLESRRQGPGQARR